MYYIFVVLRNISGNFKNNANGEWISTSLSFETLLFIYIFISVVCSLFQIIVFADKTNFVLGENLKALLKTVCCLLKRVMFLFIIIIN